MPEEEITEVEIDVPPSPPLVAPPNTVPNVESTIEDSLDPALLAETSIETDLSNSQRVATITILINLLALIILIWRFL
jgi:hypothetical protein